jgi:hypothetical protein
MGSESKKSREICEAIQKCGWTEVMTIAKAALEQANKLASSAGRYPALESAERELWFEQTVKDFG